MKFKAKKTGVKGDVWAVDMTIHRDGIIIL